MEHVISRNGSSPLRRRGEEKEEGFLEDENRQKDSLEGSSSLQGEPPLPSSTQDSTDLRLRQLEAARLLKSCGVKFYSEMSKTYPLRLIQAKVEEWRFDPGLGAGMLVKMIQGGDPIVGKVEPIERPASRQDDQPGDERSWHQKRFERNHRPLTADDFDEEGRPRRRR